MRPNRMPLASRLGRFVLCGDDVPYNIFKDGNEFCVYKHDDKGNKVGKTHGCHPTREKALAQMRALYSAEGKAMAEITKAKTKKEGDTTRPSSDYLVVEDSSKPSTWHLPVMNHGKPDPRLMGAAHAALTVGYRGNKYEGSGKDAALSKLKRMYKRMGMQWPEENSSKKSISLMELEHQVCHEIKEKMMDSMGIANEYDMPYTPIDVYVDFAIVRAPAGLYQVPYNFDVDYNLTLGEPIRVKVEYVEEPPPDDPEWQDNEPYAEMMHKTADMTIKSIGVDRIGAYAVLWGNENKKDLAEEYFDETTEELTAIFDTVGRLPYLYHHALDDTLKTTVIGIVDTMKADSIGLWYEAQLKLAKEYEEYVKKLLADGKLKTSTQTFPVARRVNSKSGHIERWPIVEITATPAPTEYRMQPVEMLKTAYAEAGCTDFACLLETKFGIGKETEKNQGAEKARYLLTLEQNRLDFELEFLGKELFR